MLPVPPITPSLATLTYLAELNRTKAHLQWMRQTEDRRTWTPHKPRPARTVTGNRSSFKRALGIARVALDPGRRVARAINTPAQGLIQSFNVPGRVMVCVRRKIRREVLHALGRAGKGGGKKRRRNEWSNVKC